MIKTNSPIRPGQASGIIVILGMLAAFAPLATDMYLPGFHLMADYFGNGEGSIEVTLSVFFLGLSVGQALYGPLIDRFGRRTPLLVGIGLYLMSTALCLLVVDIESFILLRFLQAVGGCSGMIIGRAIISDIFDERENARALSLVMVVMTLAPVVAPVLGGIIITYAGWKAIFLFMLLFGGLCGVLVWFFIPETLPVEKRRAETPRQVLQTWFQLLTSRVFIVPALVGGLAQACMFAFITGSPFVFIQLYGATPQEYGFLFALIACALIVAAQLNRMALRRYTPPFLLGVALLVNVGTGLATLLLVSTGNLLALLVPLWITIGSLGFIGANAAATAMRASGTHIGSGSSLVGILQFACAFAVSSLVAAMQNGTAYPMTLALALVGSGASAALIWFFAQNKTAKHSL